MKPKNHTWKQYVRNGVGLKLSRIGEVFGIDALTYNPVILELFHSIAIQNSPKVVESIRQTFPGIKSVIDVGCGSGAFAAEFMRAGIKAIGLEHSAHGVALARKQGVDCRSFDVLIPIERQINEKADLVYSFEVAEHVPEMLADNFVQCIGALGSIVVFAAAQKDQGGIGHINEQPIGYWVAKFEHVGFQLMLTETAALREAFRVRQTSPWFYNNACIFRKALP